MVRYRILSTDNVILADEYFVEEHYPGDYELLPEPPVPEVPVPRHITVGAFYDRFGDQKWPILASTDPVVQALIKDTSVRKFIDLDRSDLLVGLEMVKSKGFSIDPNAIINDPIQPDEYA